MKEKGWRVLGQRKVGFTSSKTYYEATVIKAIHNGEQIGKWW